MFRKLSSGQYFDPETQLLSKNNPFLKGKTMNTTFGIVNVVEAKDVEDQPEGSIFIFAAFCDSLEKSKSGKTTFANFIDFKLISNGKSKIKNRWVDFVENFEAGNGYALLCQKIKGYPNDIIIKKKFVINII